jgi:hypothetical protein
MRRTARVCAIVVLAASALSVPSRQSSAASGMRPALELKKVISFPLSGEGLPETRGGLADAIKDGLRNRVNLSPDVPTVILEGTSYPNLKGLTVDLTEAKIDSGTPIPKLRPRGPIEAVVKAEKFQFVARPMRVDGARIDLDIRAEQVELGLVRDPNRKPILMLTDAHNGTVRCDTTTRDLNRMFAASANERGKQYGLKVQRARLRLRSNDAHQLLADLRLASQLVFIPITLHFTAKVDVDADGDAHLSNLTCNGDDVAGWLITQFIRPSLAEFDNRTVPLIAFPTDRVKLRDVSVFVDGEDVHLTAAFGD